MKAEVRITADDVALAGEIDAPSGARGVIIFAHGSGSSRLSPRNRQVAAALRASGHFGTLLFDLLTPEEDRVYANRFDIGLLAERLVAASRAVRSLEGFERMPIGYFGASAGAAAAIVAAAEWTGNARAVVSRSGRPDLAGSALDRLLVPTLLIVGGLDTEVIALNEAALREIAADDRHLVIVPGATHLFEEPGTLDEAARLAAEWFERFLGDVPSSARRLF